MAYQRIENYGLIGNMRTAVLVSVCGSIDWLCLPHLDSPSVFGAIVDDEKGGRFSIRPVDEDVTFKLADHVAASSEIWFDGALGSSR